MVASHLQLHDSAIGDVQMPGCSTNFAWIQWLSTSIRLVVRLPMRNHRASKSDIIYSGPNDCVSKRGETEYRSALRATGNVESDQSSRANSTVIRTTIWRHYIKRWFRMQSFKLCRCIYPFKIPSFSNKGHLNVLQKYAARCSAPLSASQRHLELFSAIKQCSILLKRL